MKLELTSNLKQITKKLNTYGMQKDSKAGLNSEESTVKKKKNK